MPRNRRFTLMPAVLTLLVGLASALPSPAQDADLPAIVRGQADATDEQTQQAIDQLNRLRRNPDLANPLVQAALDRAEHSFDDRQRVSDELDKAALEIAHRIWNRESVNNPGSVTAHPQAERFFGEIPNNAHRVRCRVMVDTSISRWHSTGLYALPGEVVTVEVPEQWVGKGLSIRLSGHHDAIGRRGQWLRPPQSVSVRKPLDAETVEIASRFGGPVYIDTPRQPLNLGRATVVVRGATEAPIFIVGKHDTPTWRDFRDYPGPYAELVGEKCILSVPSDWVRDLEDPAGLMRYWDRVVELHDELAGTAHLRTSPERINVDIQISAGLYHAGYPLQGPQGQSRNLVDLEALQREGSWGWFHELGHEAQRRPDTAWGWNNCYTFDGSVECTVNLFTAHAMDKLGFDSRAGGWGWSSHADQVAERAKKAVESGGYQQVGVGEKLAMWLQLRDAFGWEKIGAVLAGYSKDQDENPGALPKDEQDERDQFALRMSRAVGHNLVPFLRDTWKLPISAGVEEQVADLPGWMPEGF